MIFVGRIIGTAVGRTERRAVQATGKTMLFILRVFCPWGTMRLATL